MALRIRTVYIKCKNIQEMKNFYSTLFNIQPKSNKNNSIWVEFDFGNINFALIAIEDEKWGMSNCVPVFEFPQQQVNLLKVEVIKSGGKIILEDYDGFTSAVCEDVEGNEFEITCFHD
jgi:predicted enzyme related to lactoylglutathione lyase